MYELNELIAIIPKSMIPLISKETGIDSRRICVILEAPTEMTKDEKEILREYFSYPNHSEDIAEDIEITADELKKNLHMNLQALLNTTFVEPNELHKVTGISLSTIHRLKSLPYKNGRCFLSVVTKLADVFNVTESELFFEKFDSRWLIRKRLMENLSHRSI